MEMSHRDHQLFFDGFSPKLVAKNISYQFPWHLHMVVSSSSWGYPQKRWMVFVSWKIPPRNGWELGVALWRNGNLQESPSISHGWYATSIDFPKVSGGSSEGRLCPRGVWRSWTQDVRRKPHLLRDDLRHEKKHAEHLKFSTRWMVAKSESPVEKGQSLNPIVERLEKTLKKPS